MPFQITIKAKDSKSDGQVLVKEFDKSEITLGRLPENDVVLAEDSISKKHMKVRVDVSKGGQEPRFFVTDLGSDKGTLVGKDKLTANREVELRADQAIVVGKYTVKAEPVVQTLSSGVQVIKSEARETTELPDFSQFVDVKKNVAAESKASEDGYVKVGDLRKQDLPAGKGELTVTGQVRANHIINFDFEATQLVMLKGRVMHHDSSLAGVFIDGGDLGTVTTGADGTFCFANVAEGTDYELNASLAGYRFRINGAKGFVAENSNISIEATQLLSISGNVMSKGKPLANVEIDCGVFGKCTTDDEGKYTVNDVPEDSVFAITARKDGFISRRE